MSVSTRRAWRKYGPRHVRFSPSDRTIADMLGRSDRAGAHRIITVGPRPGDTWDGYLGWVFGGTLPDGWRADEHHLSATTSPVLRWRHDDGRTVEVHRAEAWIGEVDASLQEVADAWRLVQRLAQETWRSTDVVLLATPATTGRDWWQRTIPDGVEYPVLDAATRELIAATSGQGRIEHRAEAVGPTVPGIWGFDMRLAYAGMLSEIGVGPVTHDDRPTVEPYARGRYRITATVPAGWDRVGLVGTHDGAGWRWPNTPGEHVDGWVDGAELQLLTRYGWPYRVTERLLLNPGDPLRLWRDRLLAMRSRVLASRRAGDTSAAVAKLAGSMIRSIILYTVGSWASRGTDITRSAPVADADRMIPPEAAGSVTIVGDRAVWQEPRPPRWLAMAHPEWAAAVWARCRARLLDHPAAGRGVLHVPASAVLSLRTDACYLTRDPRWPDTGRVGTLRPTVAIDRSMRTPRTSRELLAITEGN